jgi:N-acetylneuraminic acid mutarotase
MLLFAASAHAAPPALFNVQGRLLQGNTAVNGPSEMKFALVNASGSVVYWGNSADNDHNGSPDLGIAVTLNRGLYSISLGDTTLPNMAALPPAVFANNELYLRIWLKDATGAFALLTPDQRITSAGYALVAGSVPDGSVTAAKLAPGVLDAGNVTGVLGPDRIPPLDASKISSGVLSEARLPQTLAFKTDVLSSSNILSGQIVSSNALLRAELAALAAGLQTTSNYFTGGLAISSNLLSGRISQAEVSIATLSNSFNTRLDSTNSALTAAILSARTDLGAALSSSVLGLSNSLTLQIADSNAGLNQAISASQAAFSVQLQSGLSALSNSLSSQWEASSALLQSKLDAVDGKMLVTSNALADSFAQEKAASSAKILGLTTFLNALSNQVASINIGASGALPSGITAVSALNPDPALAAAGFVPFSSIQAPPWSNGTAENAPSGRTGHSAVWTGAELAVWGGSLQPGIYSSSGGIYDPQLDRWRAISSINAPTARAGHSAVWTGSEMIIWGGLNSSYEQTGARWQPAPQIWKTLPTLNAPAGRDGHVAIWTGSRMIIFGGVNSSGLLADAAIYDPALDAWTPITLPGAPSARCRAAGVWAGDRMIVWGGEGEFGPLNDGAQLLFSSNGEPASWQSLNSLDAPGARSGHAAVWTGSKMILWGGIASNVALGDGAMFDPASNSWTALPTAGAPAARAGHNLLWSGAEMLVFNGQGAAEYFGTGGAYDPLTGAWRALTAAGNPRARSGAKAVWTGSEILVFGGANQGAVLGNLQRLNPQPTWHLYRKP